ncbi:MAG: DUF4124 domain-containing protein [Gammaproteobacteria bacterium]|nr:DUF4124 domain-containing protein [Gammaproteobacteria bacterium]
MKSVYIFFLLLISDSYSVYAEIYKWTDEHGIVHYTDKSVKNSEQMNISIDDEPGQTTKSEDRAEQRRKLVDAMEEDRKEKEKLKKEEQQQARSLKRKCQWARDQLRSYQTAGSLYNLDKDGKRVHLSDQDRQKVTSKLKAQIQKYCN